MPNGSGQHDEFQTAAGKAYAVIREKILTGEFAQGDKLSQRKMAALAGVSIIPVIEALLRLEHDGLVEHRPQWGARVTVLTEEKVRDLFTFREAVECQAARLLARSITDEQRELLVAMADALDKTPRGDPGFSQRDTAFHASIADFSGSQALRDAMRRVNLLNLLKLALGRQEQVQRDAPPPGWHRRVVDAIATGKPDKAEKQMRVHIQDALHRDTRSNAKHQ